MPSTSFEGSIEREEEVETEIIEGSGEPWSGQDDFENRILKDSAYFRNLSIKNDNISVLVGWVVLIGIMLLIVLVCSNYFVWKSRRARLRKRNSMKSDTTDQLKTRTLDLKDIDTNGLRQQSISLPSIPLKVMAEQEEFISKSVNFQTKNTRRSSSTKLVTIVE